MRSSEAALVFDSLEALPAAAVALFDGTGARSFFETRAWYAAVTAHGLAAEAAPRFALGFAGGRPVLLVPLQVLAGAAALRGLSTLYTCLYEPLVDPSARAEEVASAAAGIGRYLRGWPIVRLDAIAADWPFLAPFCAGLRGAGLVIRRFNHFGNWHEPVAGRSWAAYQQERPGPLRETIRRKLARWERDAACRFELVRGGEALEAAIAAFTAVYARSWKEPEPFPEMNAATIRAAAELGVLRLGLLHVGEQAIAAQIWVIEGRRAGVLKLAHDAQYKAHSPGTVLTALMVRALLEADHVSELDFGRGDDSYKSRWATRRRQRIGLLIADPRRARGVSALARHALGRARAKLRGN
jgi:CelD/BcsL family acetyltransferase involved in cellulose biosynthesis